MDPTITTWLDYITGVLQYPENVDTNPLQVIADAGR